MKNRTGSVRFFWFNLLNFLYIVKRGNKEHVFYLKLLIAIYEYWQYG